MYLDLLARAELELIATNWRNVHPAGSSYTLDVLRVLNDQKDAGNITGDEAIALFMRVAKYAGHTASELDLPEAQPLSS